MTITVQIGNSDDKLSQEDWAKFFNETDIAIHYAGNVHFSGTSLPNKAWQNAAWVFDMKPSMREYLRDRLLDLCQEYNQESIAWTEGETTFLEPVLPCGHPYSELRLGGGGMGCRECLRLESLARHIGF